MNRSLASKPLQDAAVNSQMVIKKEDNGLKSNIVWKKGFFKFDFEKVLTSSEFG
jgi:hypothetical protein